ncbi:YdeI/OmpD-associated family protein [Deinococcus hopiensis]|uniref:Uncharacterized conserved protein YdeI, YjbR/CyaY-like superfamily, DUF1801 family n=1 Tax=Deinococcus hopiensis KR-140 TaxID=695939 RepID=A0A1W1V9P3_9DEIO|nr:YdeI/OmpD-associated family protein [Deinococcus hopiensis]SMB90102.1 Uncharacterized conserved protein YdeI, YjbR/CyaY-like superfamily, DUF1801 family [Deinococcus hopiensis KR-140]
MAQPPAHLPRVTAASRAAWRAWLQENHRTAAGVVLVYHKVGSGTPSVTYPDAVREALAFGWIDTTRYALDEQRYQQVFAPRRKGSPWSRLNKSYVAELVEAGLMTTAGQAAVDAAKQGGAWNVSEAGESGQVPEDLQLALNANPDAARHFAEFPPSIRKYVLQWIAEAKQPGTRAKRIAQTAEQAAQNLRVRGQRPPR